jgi:hypothetical protein
MLGNLTRTIHFATGEENGNVVCGYIADKNIRSVVIISHDVQDVFMNAIARTAGLEVYETVSLANLQDWQDTNPRHIHKSIDYVTVNTVVSGPTDILIYRHRADEVFFKFLETVLYGLSLTNDTIHDMIVAIKNGRAI